MGKKRVRKTQFKGVVLLFITAFIWGTSFVSQSVGSESVRPFTFIGIRTLLGAFFLLPFILFRRAFSRARTAGQPRKEEKQRVARTILFGSLMGIALAAASLFQQAAFDYSTSGKIAFITAAYMFLVPIVGLFFGKRVPVVTWLCVLAGFAGLYFLCFSGGTDFSVNRGDILAFVCAFFFTAQILMIERFTKSCDGIALSCVQFFVCGTISFVLMLLFERPSFSSIKVAAFPILYSGIMSCGIAYTLQVVGQKYCEATIASLIMCLESVFAAISGALLIQERLSGRELFGCALMFGAILVSQVPDIVRSRTGSAS